MAVHRQTLDVARPQHLGGGQWRLKNLNHVTVVFGKNGSGKSLLLRTARATDPEAMHYVAPERAGDLAFDPGQIQNQMTGAARAQGTQGNFAPSYRQQVLARIQLYLTLRGVREGPDVSLPPTELQSLIAPLVPEFEFRIIGQPPFYEIRRAATGEGLGTVQQLSSGEAQILTHALDVATICAIWELLQQPTRLLLIDEADLHLHPDLQQRLADFIVRMAAAFNSQIVIATHSTTLLAALGHYGGGRTSVIYLNNSREEQPAVVFTDVLKELATCLGGHALMGPLFGVPLLLVEGDDDYKIWSQVPRHHRISLAVIPCDGENIYKYQTLLEQILGALLEPGTAPSGFALLDGDRSNRQPSPENPQAHIRFVRLGCRESENLYLSDEVLHDLGTTWAEACAAIQARSREFGQKAVLLSSPDQWDRKTQDLKDVIKELEAILDPKHVPWTLRIGQCTGRQRPAGQLGDFLGHDVVMALWGP